jgi:hypothetical protein
MKLINKLLIDNQNLIDIDLSKTKAKPSSFLLLLNKINQNKKLRYVNLSNNQLVNIQ